MIDVEYIESKSILSKATGFMSDYDYTLNPYSGCAFGCTYCYAAFFMWNKYDPSEWGEWVQIKENALTLLKAKKKLHNKKIYMSSVTDPYQPIEKDLELVRSLLWELSWKQAKVVVQTRSPLVARDADVLEQFDNIQVNMTITTDDMDIRKAFEPKCPPNKDRLEAISVLVSSGIPSCITITPMLPIDNPEQFANDLLSSGVQKFVIQPFHVGGVRYTAGTRPEAKEVTIAKLGSVENYAVHYLEMKSRMNEIFESAGVSFKESKSGFEPPW